MAVLARGIWQCNGSGDWGINWDWESPIPWSPSGAAHRAQGCPALFPACHVSAIIAWWNLESFIFYVTLTALLNFQLGVRLWKLDKSSSAEIVTYTLAKPSFFVLLDHKTYPMIPVSPAAPYPKPFPGKQTNLQGAQHQYTYKKCVNVHLILAAIMCQFTIVCSLPACRHLNRFSSRRPLPRLSDTRQNICIIIYWYETVIRRHLSPYYRCWC
jgi:hypothetical protein